MTFEEFKKKWLGKGADWDKSYGYQCVDLYRFYLHEVLGYKQSPPVRGAADIWTTYNVVEFERITNTLTNIPKQGDIIIWNRNMGGGAGHVALVTSASLMTVTVLEQDGLIGNGTKIKTHSYRHVLGWLRSRKQAAPLTLEEKIRSIIYSGDSDNTKVSKLKDLLPR